MIENKEKNLTWFTDHPFNELVVYCYWLENKIIEMEQDVIKEI